MYVPIHSEVNKKTKVQREPNAMPQQRAPFMVSKTRWLSPFAFASDMRGSSNTDSELVRTPGKKITDIAIPVNIPKWLKASSAVYP